VAPEAAWYTTGYAPGRIDDAALALMILSGQSDGPDVRVWRKIDGEIVERLWRRELAYYPYNRSKSLILTPKGLAQAVAAAERLFATFPSPR